MPIALRRKLPIVFSEPSIQPFRYRSMDGVNGWRLEAAEIPEGAMLTVTPAKTSDLDKIRGLGFIGVMTVGMHHQQHHLAIATGRSPH